MNKLKILLFFILTNPIFAMSKQVNSRQQVMHTINQYSKEIENRDGIRLRCHGLSYAGPDKIYDGKIHVIDLSYSVDKNLKYQDAEKIFYHLVDELLETINKNEQIRGHFYHKPVSYKDLYFRLDFDYENKGHLKRDDVKQMAILDNTLICIIANQDKATNELVAEEKSPGFGHLIFTGEDSMRTIMKNLPEDKE
ncbi:MAG TPA: hypothetical protein VLE95_01555 [Chlamydiales bacterium]|nr:hypothetical protein [Chlamydiales bacterium]